MLTALPRVSGTPLNLPGCEVFYKRTHSNKTVQHRVNIEYDGEDIFDYLLEIVERTDGSNELEVGGKSYTDDDNPVLHERTKWNLAGFTDKLCEFLLQNETNEKVSVFIKTLSERHSLLLR